MNGYLKIKTSIDNSGVDKQITQLETKLNDLKATLSLVSQDSSLLSESEIIETEAQVEKLTNQLNKLKVKQQELDNENWTNITKNIEKANKGITSTIKKVGRWALAIFAVESAYGFISSTMTRVSDLNEQLGANIEYIRNSLASALMPLIEFIVNLAVKLLGIVNAISIALFGVDLFANNTADSFDNANKSAKALNKSLAGFDEMNILNDSGTTASTSGVSTTPTINMQDATKQMTKWFKNIKKKWMDLGNDMAKYLGNPSMFTSTFGAWGTAIMGITYIFYGLWEIASGVFEGIGGLIQILVGVFTGNEELISEGWQNFCDGLLKIIKGTWDTIVGIILTAVGVIIGLISELISGVIGLFLELVDFIYNSVIMPIYEFFKWLFKSIIDIFKDIGTFFKNVFTSAYNGIKSAFSNVKNFFTDIYNTITGIFKKIGTTIGNVVGSAFKTAINGALTLVENVLNTPINAINSLLDVINAVPGINLGKLDTIKLPRLASGGIVNNPGKGVMMGSYIAGEAGREGILPLTDPNAMAQLGREIGKWINVNNTSLVYLDGRLIKKSQDKVREELVFATNGGKS